MNERWVTVEHPGYNGKSRDANYEKWNQEHGVGNWRLAWELADGQIFNYEDIIYKVYVPGYVDHFRKNPGQDIYLTSNYSYCYDKDMITREEAFDIYSQYEKPRVANQFHDKACNIALEYFIGRKFHGEKPIQVRQGKVDGVQPEGWPWSPGFIRAVRSDLIPDSNLTGWWQPGSIEDFYQKSKVLQVKV